MLTFTREDYDRQNAAYMARAQQNFAELEAFQGTAEAFMAIAIEQQNINVQNLLDTRNQTDILGRAAEAYSRDFILSSDGLAAMSGAQAGANSGVVLAAYAAASVGSAGASVESWTAPGKAL